MNESSHIGKDDENVKGGDGGAMLMSLFEPLKEKEADKVKSKQSHQNTDSPPPVPMQPGDSHVDGVLPPPAAEIRNRFNKQQLHDDEVMSRSDSTDKLLRTRDEAPEAKSSPFSDSDMEVLPLPEHEMHRKDQVGLPPPQDTPTTALASNLHHEYASVPNSSSPNPDLEASHIMDSSPPTAKYRTIMTQFSRHFISSVMKSTLLTISHLSTVIGAPFFLATSLGAPEIIVPLSASLLATYVISSVYMTVLLNPSQPSSYPTADLFLIPFVMSTLRTALESPSIAPNQLIPTFNASLAISYTICGALIYTATATNFKPLRVLVGIGEFIPYPVFAGIFASIGLLLIKLSITTICETSLKELIYKEPDPSMLFVLAVSLLSSIFLTAFQNRFPRAFFVIMATCICVSHITSHFVPDSIPYLFFPSTLYSAASTSLSSYPPWYIFENAKHISPLGLFDLLPSALITTFVFLARVSIHIPAFSKAHRKSFPGNTYRVSTRDSKVYAISMIITAITGGLMPPVQDGGRVSTYHRYGVRKNLPNILAAVTLMYAYFTNMSMIQYLPRLALSIALGLVGFVNFYNWGIAPLRTLSNAERMVLLGYMMTTEFFGMLPSVALGGGICTVLFIFNLTNTSVVKYLGNGLTLRSAISRTERDGSWLDSHGDRIQVLCLQSFLFFGNATSVSEYVHTMFEPVKNPSPDVPPIPDVVVLDMSLLLGMDLSAIDVIKDIIQVCLVNNCCVIMSGAQGVRKSMSRNGITVNAYLNLSFSTDLETSLGVAEDQILKDVAKVLEREKTDAEVRISRRTEQLSKEGVNQDSIIADGFRHALSLVDSEQGLGFCNHLMGLASFVKPLDLQPGQSLYDVASMMFHGPNLSPFQRGLFFIEYGAIKVERDPNISISHSHSLRKRRSIDELNSRHTISGMKARSTRTGYASNSLKRMNSSSKRNMSFRLARVGPGWILGCREVASGLHDPAMYVAVTKARLYFLSKEEIARLEAGNPHLAVILHRTIAHIMAKDFDNIQEQMAQYHTIHSSRSSGGPVRRETMGNINAALRAMQEMQIEESAFE